MQFSGKRAAFIIRKNEQFNSKLASKLLGKEISKNNIYKYALLKINSVFLLPAAISRYKTGMFYNILAVEPKSKNIVQKIQEKSFAISFFVDYKNSYMNFGTAYSSTSTLSYSLNDYFVRIFSLYISAYNFFIDTNFNFIDKANQIKYENVLNKIFYFFLMDKSRILKFSSLFFEYKTFKFKIKIESLLGSFITDNWIYVHHEGFSIDSKGLFIEDKYKVLHINYNEDHFESFIQHVFKNIEYNLAFRHSSLKNYNDALEIIKTNLKNIFESTKKSIFEYYKNKGKNKIYINNTFSIWQYYYLIQGKEALNASFLVLFCSSEDFNEEKTKEFEIIVITFLKDNKRKVCLTEILEHEALKKTVKSVKHDPYMIGTTIEQKELVGKYFYLD